MLPIILVLSLLAPTSRSAIQNAYCSALTASEIEAAVGTKPAHSAPTDMDADKGQRMLGCIWMVQSPKIQVTLGTGRLPAGATSKHLQLLTSNPGMDSLRARGYTVEKKEFPNNVDAQRRDVHVHVLCDREVDASFDHPLEPKQEALDRSGEDSAGQGGGSAALGFVSVPNARDHHSRLATGMLPSRCLT